MKTVVTAFARKRGDRIVLDDEEGYRRDVKEFAKDGASVIVRVSKATRSEKANAYLWSTVYPAIVEGSESGNSDVELHDAYCAMFLPTDAKQVEFFNRLTGETLTVTTSRRSSALNGQAFFDFVERIREHARTFWGIEVPDPDPDYWKRNAESVANPREAGMPAGVEASGHGPPA